jgi:hypothetical protein
LPGNSSNSGYSSASVLKFSLNGGTRPAELTSKRVLVITSWLGPTENTALLVLLKSFLWDRGLFVKVLPHNGSGIFAYLAVIV